MYVRDGMSTMVLTVGPGHTLRQAAELMSKRRVGAAVVMQHGGLRLGSACVSRRCRIPIE